MQTTQSNLCVHKHFFSGLDYKGEQTEICSCGETVEKALKSCSGGADQWSYVRTEEIPYKWGVLANDVAACLPGQWEAKPISEEYADCNFSLIRDDGLTLFMAGPGYSHKDAFQFSLSAPRKDGRYVEVYDDKHNRIPCPSINVGGGKSAEQMAKDVGRRLLPDAERVAALVAAKIDAENDFTAKRVATLKALCAALGVEVPSDYHSKETRFSGYADSLDFEVNSGDSVTIKLRSVPLAVALKAVKALKA